MKKVYEEAAKGNKNRAKLRLVGASRHMKFSFLRKYVLRVLTEGTYESSRRPATQIASAYFDALHGSLQF